MNRTTAHPSRVMSNHTAARQAHPTGWGDPSGEKGTQAVVDRTVEYFSGPARERTKLLPRGFSATVRLDLRRPGRIDHWYLIITERDISISQEGEREADCVISADGEVFDRLVAGADPTAATLRSELVFRGSPSVMIHFQRLLPGPPDARGPKRVHGGGGEGRGR